MSQWLDYYTRVASRPNSLVVASLEDCVVNKGAALDLGAGNMRDSGYLLNQGFDRIVAVDNSLEAEEFYVEGTELYISRIEDYEIEPNAFDFVISCNTLFYLEKESVGQVFERVLRGLRPRGIFACNLLGSRDTCIRSVSPLFDFEREEIHALCNDFTVRSMGEIVQTTTFPYSMSHQWCLILQKP